MSDTKVKQVMTRLVVTVSPDQTVHEAAERLSANGISGAPVVEDDEVIGMVTESDIIHSVAPVFPRTRHSILELLTNTAARKPTHARGGPLVRDVMSSMVVFQISPEASIWEAASSMDHKGVKRLPVIDDDGRLVGIISRADVIRAIGRSDKAIRSDVVETLEILGPETFEDLSVSVRHGSATLRGKADRKSTKQIAVKLVRRVPGVIQVRDELVFASDDLKIKADFSARDYENLTPFGP